MKLEHSPIGLRSAPKFLGLLCESSVFNLWFEAGIPIMTLLKNPDDHIKSIGNLAFMNALTLLEKFAKKHSKITS